MRAVAERTSVDQWSVPLWAAAEDGGRNCDRFDVSDLRVAAVDTPIHTYAQHPRHSPVPGVVHVTWLVGISGRKARRVGDGHCSGASEHADIGREWRLQSRLALLACHDASAVCHSCTVAHALSCGR